jgi:hypothetical protein
MALCSKAENVEVTGVVCSEASGFLGFKGGRFSGRPPCRLILSRYDFRIFGFGCGVLSLKLSPLSLVSGWSE